MFKEKDMATIKALEINNLKEWSNNVKIIVLESEYLCGDIKNDFIDYIRIEPNGVCEINKLKNDDIVLIVGDIDDVKIADKMLTIVNKTREIGIKSICVVPQIELQACGENYEDLQSIFGRNIIILRKLCPVFVVDTDNEPLVWTRVLDVCLTLYEIVKYKKQTEIKTEDKSMYQAENGIESDEISVEWLHSLLDVQYNNEGNQLVTAISASSCDCVNMRLSCSRITAVDELLSALREELATNLNKIGELAKQVDWIIIRIIVHAHLNINAKGITQPICDYKRSFDTSSFSDDFSDALRGITEPVVFSSQRSKLRGIKKKHNAINRNLDTSDFSDDFFKIKKALHMLSSASSGFKENPIERSTLVKKQFQFVPSDQKEPSITLKIIAPSYSVGFARQNISLYQTLLDLEKKTAQSKANEVAAIKSREDTEDMMGFIAHSTRGDLVSLESSLKHGDDVQATQTIVATLKKEMELFSFLSSNPNEIIDQMKNDLTGKVSLTEMIHHVVATTTLMMLSPESRGRRLINHRYWAIVKDQDLVPIGMARKDFVESPELIDLQKSLFINFLKIMNNPVSVNKWIKKYFGFININIDESIHIEMSQNGMRSTVLSAILSELLVNAFKYGVSGHSEIIMELNCTSSADSYIFSCTNSPAKMEQKRGKGSKKGVESMGLLLSKLKLPALTVDSKDGRYSVSFTMSKQLIGG